MIAIRTIPFLGRLCAAALVFSLSVPALASGGGLELTPEERSFLQTQGEITIGCPVDNCPVLFQDGDGEIKGITVDILDMVSASTGLSFQYQPLPQGSVTYQLLRELGVDMVASVEYNEANLQSTGIAMTAPYLQAEKVFVCKKDARFDPSEHLTVAVASGSQTLERVIRQQYPNFQVAFYNSTEQALSALLSGEADAVLQNQYSLERILAKPLYDDLRVVAAASLGDRQCLASLLPISQDGQNVISDETRLLLSILDKGIAALDQREVSFITIRQAAENAYSLTLGDMLYRYRYTAAALAACLALMLALLWYNLTLRRRRAEQLAAEQKARELAAINGHMHEQQILLMDALERAKEGSQAKSSFLFNMSHDIRTPMNAILGFTTIAYHNRDNPEKLTDCLNKIQYSADHLLQLIDNVLDMSRIESGKVILTEDLCSLTETIQRVQSVLQAEMDKRELQVRADLSEVRNDTVYCDSLRLSQILFNLLSNATKFSKPGGEISIRLEQQLSDMRGFAAYQLQVRDTGIGMSPEFLSRIFQPFERERTSTVSKTQGTGLGMSITKSLVDLMGGAIEVDSQPGQGTCFTLRFTFKIHDQPLAPEEAPVPAPGDFAGRRLLLVEDNELNREIALELLGEEGFLLETAEDGQQALDMVRTSQPGYYDAVLMDIQMPVMDGYQSARAIRSLENQTLASIPIIAMTANAFNEDRQAALASGMNAHVAKPIDLRTLRTTLKNVLPPRDGAASPPPGGHIV